MDWLKKKKEEAKQAAAKMTNKRTAFRGDGNVLGGGESAAASAPPAAAAPAGFARKQKAMDQRGNAWEKRVTNARKARLQQDEDRETRFQYTEPAPAPPPVAGPPPTVLSNEEVKARELQKAHEQMGFNPYAATFSSSTQATSAMNSIGSGAGQVPPPPPSASSNFSPPPAPFPAIPAVAAPHNPSENGAVYVLLRQDPPRAITAAETLAKILSNVVQNPQEEKFRKIRLSNAAIQSKLVAVPGAVDLLEEAGFLRLEMEGEPYLMLTADAFQTERVQSAIDRTEVALIQLQHDSSNA
ncbi:hypothetical protein BBJ28_00013097 [Nothophytophthora sp. Chile5]|nr:hypothetical protein BBJ28_00013097 [Nothophytophthora sp. Chile5]